MCRCQAELAVIAAGAPRPVFLADHVQWRRPWRIGTADDVGRLQLAELCFCLAQLVRIQAACLGEHRAARRHDCIADLVFRRWFSFPVADNGWEQSQQGLYRQCYGPEGGGEFGAQGPGGGGRFGERFQRLRVQHLAADWVNQQPVGGQEIYTRYGSVDGGEQKGDEKCAQPER